MNLKKFKETKTVVLPCLSLFKSKEKKLKKKKKNNSIAFVFRFLPYSINFKGEFE